MTETAIALVSLPDLFNPIRVAGGGGTQSCLRGSLLYECNSDRCHGDGGPRQRVPRRSRERLFLLLNDVFPLIVLALSAA
jgi:hypothetical protein